LTDSYFSRLFNEHHEVHRIEEGVENTSTDYPGELKNKRLKH
jgi:uncharacterized protein YdcH (DUF465 family)